jgi:DNA polymerase (family 10)
VEAAKNGKLPQLIEEKDLKGTFHCHTQDSDGENTLEELVTAARDLGWEYLGIADHSKESYQANGMTEERLLAQLDRIQVLNNKMDYTFQIFAGLECDILKDGTLYFSDEILSRLDYVIASIHRRYKLEEKEMTQRLIKAIENPYTTMVGHFTGRLLLHREPYNIDTEKVIDACIANDKIMELNAYPSRLDMDWRLWIRSRDRGLKCVINPDAHSISNLLNCRYGINIARKGWLEKRDVINTLSLGDMQIFLKSRK